MANGNYRPHHIIDIVPTILEVTGIQPPATVNGIAQKPIEGISMAYTFDSANANAPSKRDTQYFEMFGSRALYHDSWIATTVPPQPPWLMDTVKMPDVLTDYKWELYNIADNSASSPLCVRVSVDLVTMYWTHEARNSLWDLGL